MNLLEYYRGALFSLAAPYLFMILLAVSLLITGNVEAQTEADIKIYKQNVLKDRKYLIEQLSFYYVDNPNSEASEAYKLDNAAIAEGKKDGAFWKISNPLIPRFVEGLLCESDLDNIENKGISVRQGDAAEVLRILNKPVQVWIYNDTKPLKAHALEKYAPCTDSLGYVLPCATTFRKDNKQSDLWAGFMHLGIKHTVTDFNPQNRVAELYDSLQSLYSKFMHMLTHTQDHSNIDTHELHTCETQRWFKLRQEDHFFVRAMPDKILAYQEGMANGFGLSIHHYEYLPALKWLEKNGYFLVETFPASTDPYFMDKNWLYDQIRKVAGEGDSIPGMPHYRGYKIRDLPAKFIIQNEIIPGLILSRMGDSELKRALIKTHAERADPNTSFHPWATLFKHLCEGSLPAGETVLTAFKLPADKPKPYLYPLVYADYFTAFKAKDKEEFGEIFGGELPQPWIDLYWDTVMEEVRKAVPASVGEPEKQPTEENPDADLYLEIQKVDIKHLLTIMKVLHM